MQLQQILDIVEERRNYTMQSIEIGDIAEFDVARFLLSKQSIGRETNPSGWFIEVKSPRNEEYGIVESATSQLLARLGIRRAYKNISSHEVFMNYDGTAQFLRDMMDFSIKANTNKKIKLIVDEPKRKIMGVVGDGYHRTSHYDIITPALEKFGEDINIRTSYINDKVMHVNFSPTVERTARQVGEVVGFGPSVFNSDCGFSAVGVGIFALILRCTNGQVLPKKFIEKRIIHSTQNPMAKFMEVLDSYFNNDMGMDFIRHIDKVANRPPILIDSTEIPNITRRFKIPQRFEEGIIDYAENENHDLPLNGYGIFNAINGFASHHVDDEVDIEELMMAGFQILQIGVDY